MTGYWHNLERHGDRVALITAARERISYADLAHLADGAGFAGRPRALALIELANGVPAIAAYLGALRAGHAAILANAGSPAALAGLVEQYRPELVWTVADGLAIRAEAPAHPLHPDLAVMLSTSGSTGSAKLVRLSASAVAANARSIGEYLGIGPDDRAITTLPPAYSYGLSVINSHLAAGATLVLTDLSVTDRAFAALAAAERATSMAGVPYTYELLEASGLLDDLPGGIRTLTQAGGRLAPDRIERVRKAAEAQGARFFVMYGQTEATARMSYVPPERLADFPDCIGQPIPGGRFAFLDPETGAPADRAGELVYHGPNIMMGYAESREDLARDNEIDALVTGDLAELAAPGIYRITGRKSRFVKIFGLRLALDEIEREAARRGWQAVATGDDSRIVLATQDARDPAPLADQLAAHFKLPPDRIAAVTMAPLPRLANGKIDYRAIVAAAPAPAEQAAPAGEEEVPLATYAAFLARLARKPQVPDEASFQAIGGDSLNYVEASILLEHALGEAPPGWEAMTLRELALCAPATDTKAGGAPPAPRSTLDTHYIQAMRSIAILLVVAAHTVTPVNQVFGVEVETAVTNPFRHVNAIFLFVAGYLFQYLLSSFQYRSYLRVKLQTVILPYLIVSIPALILTMFNLRDRSHMGAPPWLHGPPEWLGYALLTGTHLGPLWFIPMIAIIYLLSPLLKRIDEHPRSYAIILPLLILSGLVGRSPNNSNPLQSLAFYLPIYLVGMASCRYRGRILPLVGRWWPPLLLAYLVPSVFSPHMPGFDELALVSKTLFCFGLLGLLSRHSDRIPASFDRIGELSFGIYFIHGYIFLFLGPVRKHFNVALHGWGEYVAAFTVTAAAAAAISVLIVLAVKRVFGSRSRFIVGA